MKIINNEHTEPDHAFVYVILSLLSLLTLRKIKKVEKKRIALKKKIKVKTQQL
ncbi:hypothetical protein [Domibacillus indicus]|uniref:hypothetical protein n=1 Tax=Domibacillus indicus TaxID=1437523 RepID=UPI000A4BF558|nr:hypothetical protein [Domibacillus indicus]